MRFLSSSGSSIRFGMVLRCKWRFSRVTLGFVEEAERDRYVAGRLRNRADIDRAEAAELWRSLQCCSGSPLVNHWLTASPYDVGSNLSKSPT